MNSIFSQRRFLRALVALLAVSAVAVAGAPAQDLSRTIVVPDQEALSQTNASIEAHLLLPDETSIDRGWWTDYIARPLEDDRGATPLSLDDTLIRTLEHSAQIKVFSDLPLIRETAVIEACAAFDWLTYMDSRWDDVSEPIGNALTAGAGVSRFSDHNFIGRGGMRRRTLGGGSWDMSQQFGWQDNNSQFFVPDPQGTARLVLGYTQPLMRGRGRFYNTSLITLAKIDKAVADQEFSRQTQSHLLEVARAYWALYLERGVLYQRVNNYRRGKVIADRLEARRDLDASPSQLASARAAVADRRDELMRQRAAVRNAESKLRALVNAPDFCGGEMLPIDLPTFIASTADECESFGVAMRHRPEVRQSVQRIKAASVRLGVAKNELMPLLNLVTQTYASGLAANGQSFTAFNRQFNTGAPSYGIGLQFQRPVGNRAYQARYQRRRLELRQLQNQYVVTLETIRNEVAVAVRELETSLTELTTKRIAMDARAKQLTAMTRRYEALPDEGTDAALTLENLLVAQDQLTAAEFDYLSSQLTYNLSLINLKRVTGLLLQSEGITSSRLCVNGLPTNVLTKTHEGRLIEDEVIAEEYVTEAMEDVEVEVR